MSNAGIHDVFLYNTAKFCLQIQFNQYLFTFLWGALKIDLKELCEKNL